VQPLVFFDIIKSLGLQFTIFSNEATAGFVQQHLKEIGGNVLRKNICGKRKFLLLKSIPVKTANFFCLSPLNGWRKKLNYLRSHEKY
ncbi:MAG: hypothetical protein KGQ80_07280, partial [Bacteroidetes bacterium]|nr:hypothetical protein [Bacteroidota bacterium]